MVVGPARRFQHLVGPLVCGFDKISEMQRIPVRKTFRSLVFSDGAGEVVALFVCEVIGYALNEDSSHRPGTNSALITSSSAR